jgi:hypothetical protein
MSQPENFRKMNLEESEVDGIAFHIDDDKSNEDRISWNFTIVKFNEENERNFHKTEVGYKYQILLYEGDKADFFEAVIGDVKHYVNNMVKSKQEGIMIKKCKKSEEIMNKIFKGRLIETLKYRVSLANAGAV